MVCYPLLYGLHYLQSLVETVVYISRHIRLIFWLGRSFSSEVFACQLPHWRQCDNLQLQSQPSSIAISTILIPDSSAAARWCSYWAMYWWRLATNCVKMLCGSYCPSDTRLSHTQKQNSWYPSWAMPRKLRAYICRIRTWTIYYILYARINRHSYIYWERCAIYVYAITLLCELWTDIVPDNVPPFKTFWWIWSDWISLTPNLTKGFSQSGGIWPHHKGWTPSAREDNPAACHRSQQLLKLFQQAYTGDCFCV